jgi:dihydroflavonol-4-reductase
VRPGRDLVAGVEPSLGDVLDFESVVAACQGVEVVYHIAGINRMCDPRPAAMFRVNVDGTRNIIRACRAAAVGRLVYTSSAAALGEPPGSVGNEYTVHRGYFHSNYERSKYEAEQVVRTEAGDIDYVILNPSSVQGPGRASGTGQLILDAVNGKLPFLVDTQVSIVDIDDCARGHLLAADQGGSGRRYVLNSFSMGITEAIELLSEILGRAVRVRLLPAPLVSVAGATIGVPFRAMRRHAPICAEMVRTLRHGHLYDGSRATRELGLVYTTPEETLGRLLVWARREGLVR